MINNSVILVTDFLIDCFCFNLFFCLIFFNFASKCTPSNCTIQTIVDQGLFITSKKRANWARPLSPA